MNSDRALEKVYPRLFAVLPKASAPDIVLSRDDSPVERLFLADVVIFYAFDLGSRFEIVSYRMLRELGVTDSDLHEKAKGNLRALNLEVKAHQGAGYVMLTAGGNFEATLLLLPEIWESVAEMVKGDVIASVPSRDVLIFTGAANDEDIAILRSATSKVLEQADKALSRAFFRRVSNSWTIYEGFAA
jgi:uncharacterized protein YtpQ (UPF0354 family)